MMRFPGRITPLVLLGLLLAGCVTSPTGRSQLLLVSPDEAINSSRAAYQELLGPLEEEGKVDNHPAFNQRVRRIAGRIVAQAIRQFPETRDWAWQVRVIDDPEQINAWCMPGGRMAVYTGLIEKIQSTDDELAQVMGHEAAHAIANHGAEKMSILLATELSLISLSVALSDHKDRHAIMTGSVLAASLAVNLPNSRTAEREADKIGLELAARAGFNPQAAITLWDKMNAQGGSHPPEFLSTHPAPANRQAELAAMVPEVLPVYHQARAEGALPVYRFGNGGVYYEN